MVNLHQRYVYMYSVLNCAKFVAFNILSSLWCVLIQPGVWRQTCQVDVKDSVAPSAPARGAWGTEASRAAAAAAELQQRRPHVLSVYVDRQAAAHRSALANTQGWLTLLYYGAVISFCRTIRKQHQAMCWFAFRCKPAYNIRRSTSSSKRRSDKSSRTSRARRRVVGAT